MGAAGLAARALRPALATAAVVAAVALLAGDPAAQQRGARVERVTIESDAVGRRLAVTVVVPGGAAEGRPRPLLMFLHGRGTPPDGYLSSAFFAALARPGPRAPVVAFPSGGDHSYWHDRRSGAWGRWVTEEAIPRVTRDFGADPERVAVGGISMGGFGAYDLARLNPGRFCAVGGHSPALWTSAAQTAPGAFDDAADFARHDVVAAARRGAKGFRDRPVWLDTGDGDPFRPGHRAFVAALRGAGLEPTVRVWPGGHDGAYWDRHWRDYLAFYARVLARCSSQ